MGFLYNETAEQCNFTALLDGIRGDGTISGLAVGESSPAAMSVLVASGSCTIGGDVYTEGSGQNVVITAADVTNPRKDIISYDPTTSAPICTAGTPAAAPVPPSIPGDDILLGIVLVAANVTTIVNADITDGRVEILQIPTGTIRMYTGLISTIQTGWQLCDGTNGSPDLRSKFVRCAPAATEAGGSGGSDTHTITVNEMPAHRHNVPSSSGGTYWGIDVTYTNCVAHNVNTLYEGGGAAHNNMPAYYEVLYIYKL